MTQIYLGGSEMQYYLNPKLDFINKDNVLKINQEHFLECMNDARISWKAKGVLTVCMSFGKEYFTLHDLVTSSKNGQESSENGLKELIKYEYVCAKETGKHEGCVYILSDTYDNYKIGFAVDLAKRLRAYNTHLPYEPIIIKTIQSSNMRETEKFLHDKFKSKLIRNEWYKLDSDDIEYIKTL